MYSTGMNILASNYCSPSVDLTTYIDHIYTVSITCLVTYYLLCYATIDMMALVTQRVIVVLLCTLSQCSAAGTLSFSSGSASQTVMEGDSLSVCVMAILDPGDSIEVGLSVTPAGKQSLCIFDYECIIIGGLDVPTNTLHLTDTTTTDCWMITATDDDIYEVDSQSFILNLVLVNPTSSDIVLTDPSTATITVMDDEGKSKRFQLA